MNYNQYYGQGQGGSRPGRPRPHLFNFFGGSTAFSGQQGLPSQPGMTGGAGPGPTPNWQQYPYGQQPPGYPLPGMGGSIARPTGRPQYPYGQQFLKAGGVNRPQNRPPYGMYPMPPGSIAGSPPYQTPPYIPPHMNYPRYANY